MRATDGNVERSYRTDFPARTAEAVGGRAAWDARSCAGRRALYVPGGGAIAIAIQAGDGVTNDLVRRVYQHREKLVKGFTAKFGVARLVYFEQFGEMGAAIRREKQLKRWNRAWKIRLIEEKNPNWIDLYPSIDIR